MTKNKVDGSCLMKIAVDEGCQFSDLQESVQQTMGVTVLMTVLEYETLRHT